MSITKGTYLFLDGDWLEIDDVVRTVPRPQRHRATPVITNGKHHCANFSHTVIKNSGPGYTCWYVAADEATLQRYTARSTSPDGYNWTVPTQIDGTFTREFSDILDEGAPGPERYKGYRKSNDGPPRWYGCLMLSPDGVKWHEYGRVTPAEYGETWQPYKFGGNGYGLLHRWNIQDYEWTDKEGDHHQNTIKDPTFVRCIGMTNSIDPRNYPASKLLFAPDSQDSGETQFYAVSGIVKRGQYYVGFLHVLRDDLIATGAKPGAYGTGYSVLIWSKDGVTWRRSREPFLLPNFTAGTWDHAVTWIDSIIPVGNEIRLYYGGYQHGHKVFTDRQIGVVKIKKDRFMAATGVMRTRPFINVANLLHLNLDGAVTVRLLDENNYVLRAATVQGNSVGQWVGVGIKEYRGKRIKLEFEGGKLYSFKLS